jgi:signal transduction histidine kinase
VTTTTTTPRAQTYPEQLAKLNAEVASLREQLRRAQRLAAVGTMTAMVAHEFNNILTPIINYARMARTNPKFTGKAIDRAADGGEKASSICKAILGLTGPESSAQAVSVAELICETLAAMGREPAKDGIDLVVEAPPDLTIRARRVELGQVLLNLVINARAAVLVKPGPRRIQIGARRERGFVFIEVGDNGVGIAPENIEKIFHPFFTTKQSQDGGDKGHGLGLTICRDIVTAMGGDISVSSKLGEGTTFAVRLPG